MIHLYEVHAEATRDADRPREQDLHGTFRTFLNAGRPCHYQGPLPTAELPVEDEEGQTTEVVAVQVSEYHTAVQDPLAVQAILAHLRRSGAPEPPVPPTLVVTDPPAHWT